MLGQLVELNKQVWLLLTHYNVSQLHGLCVGAMVSKSLFKLSTKLAVHVIGSIMVIAWPDPWYQCSAGSCKACAHLGPWQCRGEGAAAWCLLSVTCVCCSFLWFECYLSQHPLQQVLWGPSSYFHPRKKWLLIFIKEVIGLWNLWVNENLVLNNRLLMKQGLRVNCVQLMT